MIFRNLDADGDWTFGNGKGNYISLNPAIGLNIKTRLLSWVGDCFFDQKAGIDWVNRLGSKNQRVLLELDIKRIILQSFGVTGLVAFNAVLDERNRKIVVDSAVNTINSLDYKNSLTVEI